MHFHKSFSNFALDANYNVMAIDINPIPPLRGKAAERFLLIAEKNFLERRASLDYTKQAQQMREILKKSGFK